MGAIVVAAEASAPALAGVRPSTWVYVSAVVFAALAVAFGATQNSTTDTSTWVVGGLGIAFHLALVPVVLLGPAPRWAQAAGLVWLAIDITSNVMLIAGASETSATTVRLIGHLPAGAWIAVLSWQLGGVVRPVGAALSAWLVGYTLVARVVPETVFMPAMVLMLVWLPLLGRALGHLTD
jgi:hypothetical protein